MLASLSGLVSLNPPPLFLAFNLRPFRQRGNLFVALPLAGLAASRKPTGAFSGAGAPSRPRLAVFFVL